MGTPHIQIPIDALHDVGEALEKISESGKSIGAAIDPGFSLMGTDSVSGYMMVNAVWDFENTWLGSRETLLKNTNLLGEVSKKIAESARNLDEIKASGMLQLAGAIEGKVDGGTITSTANVYAFNEDVSSQSEEDIRATMHRLLKIIESIRTSVENLKPSWKAVEADQYYTMMANFDVAAAGVANILVDVEQALISVHDDTSTFRTSIREALNGTE